MTFRFDKEAHAYFLDVTTPLFSLLRYVKMGKCETQKTTEFAKFARKVTTAGEREFSKLVRCLVRQSITLKRKQENPKKETGRLNGVKLARKRCMSILGKWKNRSFAPLSVVVRAGTYLKELNTTGGKVVKQKLVTMFTLRYMGILMHIERVGILQNIASLWRNISEDTSIATRKFITLTKLKMTTDYAI